MTILGLVIAALGRQEIAEYVEALFLIYLILIFARILLSWIPRLPYNRYLQIVVGFVNDVTNPYLNVFRRVIPPVGGGGFGLDLSPILAIIVLYVLQGLVVGMIEG